MDSRKNCDWCQIVYGLETRPVEILLATKYFLGTWSNQSKREILLIQKKHEPFPKHPDHAPEPPLPEEEEFEDDLESARGKARQLLNSGASCYHRWPTGALYYHFQETVSKEPVSGAVLLETYEKLISLYEKWFQNLPEREKDAVKLLRESDQLCLSPRMLLEEMKNRTADGKETLELLRHLDIKLRAAGQTLKDFLELIKNSD